MGHPPPDENSIDYPCIISSSQEEELWASPLFAREDESFPSSQTSSVSSEPLPTADTADSLIVCSQNPISCEPPPEIPTTDDDPDGRGKNSECAAVKVPGGEGKCLASEDSKASGLNISPKKRKRVLYADEEPASSSFNSNRVPLYVETEDEIRYFNFSDKEMNDDARDSILTDGNNTMEQEKYGGVGDQSESNLKRVLPAFLTPMPPSSSSDGSSSSGKGSKNSGGESPRNKNIV